MKPVTLAFHTLLQLAVVERVLNLSSVALPVSLNGVGVVNSGSLFSRSTLVAQSREAIAALKQGRELYQQYNYDAALRSFEQVTKQDPDFADAWYWQGMTLYNQRDYQNAIVSFKRATQIDAKNPIFWKARGDAMNALAQYTPEQDTAIERYDLAVDAYDRALKFMPANSINEQAATWMGRSESLFAQGNLLASQQNPVAASQKYQEATTSYNEVIKLAALTNDINQQVDALWQQGEAYRRIAVYGEESNKQTSYRDALSSFDRAIQLKSDFSDCWYRRGRVLEELNQLKEALNSYGQAIHIDPEFAEALHWQGKLLAKLKRFEAAFDSFDRATKGTIRSDWALETKLNPAEIWYGRGLALYQLKRYEQAVRSFDQAIKLKPDFPDAQKYRSYAQDQLNR